MALAGYAVGAAHGFVLVRSEYPRSKPALEAAAARARGDGLARRGHPRQRFDFDVTIVEGAGSYVVGEETALLACLQGLRGTVSARPPFPAERGVHGMPTVVNNVETLCNIALRRRARRRRLPRAQPRRRDGRLEARLLQRALRAAGRRTRSRSAISMRELCEERRRRPARRARDQGGADRRPARRDPARLACSTRRSTSRRSPPRAAWSATAASSPSTTAPTCATSPATCCASAPHESCGKCFPCRIGLRRAHAVFAGDAPVDRARLEALLETLELGSCARTAAACRRRSAAARPLPGGAGAGVIARRRSTGSRSRSRRGRRCSTPPAPPAAGSRRSASTSARRRSAPAACAWSASRARPSRCPACTTPCRDGMAIDTEDPTARRVAGAVVELVLSRAARAAGAAHRAGAGGAALGVGEPRWPGAAHAPTPDDSAIPTSPSATSCASPAGAACAPATRCRGRSR